MATADAAALGMMADDVLAPDVIALALDKLMAMLDAPAEDVNARRARLTATLRTAEKELSHLQTAIAAGNAPETLVAGIRDRERKRQDLLAELKALEVGPMVLAAAPKIRSEALRQLDDWRGLLGQHVATSRQLLRKLLDRERFVFYPKGRGNNRWYELGVTPTLERFFNAVPMLKKAGTSPTGFEPVSWP